MNIEQLKDSALIRTFDKIDKGWSADEKYFIETENQEKFLLRIASIDSYARKKQEFERMQDVYLLGILMSEHYILTW